MNRFNAAVTVFKKHSVLVFGGQTGNGQLLNDGYLLDIRTNNTQRILGANKDLKFQCNSLAQLVCENNFIAVGHSEDGQVHMARLTVRKNDHVFELRSIKDYKYDISDQEEGEEQNEDDYNDESDDFADQLDSDE